MFSKIRLVKRRPAKLVAALLMTTAGGAIALEIDANLEARATLRRILATHQGLRVEQVAADPFSGRLILHGITTRTGGATVTIGRLDLDLPSPRSSFGWISAAHASPFDDAPGMAPESGGGPATIDSTPAAPARKPGMLAPGAPTPGSPAPKSTTPAPVASANPNGTSSAENVVIVAGDVTFRIKRIDMTGTSLTSADLTALLDSKSARSAEARLKGFSAAAVVVPELLADDTSNGHEQHMSMTHVLLANVVSGKAAAGSAGEISFSLKDDKSLVNGTTGAIEATDIDFRQIAHVFGTVRANDNEPILPLYDAFIVNTIKVTNVTQKTNLSIAAFKEIGAKARPLKTDIATIGSTKPDPSDAKSAAVFDDMTHSFQIGLLQMTDIALRNDAPEGTTTLTLGSAAMNSFADSKVGGLSFSDLRLTGPEMKFGIGSLNVGAFAIPPAKGAASDARPVAPPSTIDLSQVDVDAVTKTEKTDDKPASTTTVKFKLGRIAFAAEAKPGEIPTKASLSVNDISFDVPPDDPAGFNAMGYSHVTVSSALSSTYNADAQNLDINNFSINGTDMGSAVTTIHLINVGKGLISPDPQVQTSSAVAMLLKGIDLKIANAGLFEKALAYKAGKDGMTVAQERDLGVDFFQNKLPVAMNGNPKIKIVGDAVAKFIAAPKTLHLAVQSKAGLGVAAMGMLSSPDLILDMVDVQASAND